MVERRHLSLIRTAVREDHHLATNPTSIAVPCAEEGDLSPTCFWICSRVPDAHGHLPCFTQPGGLTQTGGTGVLVGATIVEVDTMLVAAENEVGKRGLVVASPLCGCVTITICGGGGTITFTSGARLVVLVPEPMPVFVGVLVVKVIGVAVVVATTVIVGVFMDDGVTSLMIVLRPQSCAAATHPPPSPPNDSAPAAASTASLRSMQSFLGAVTRHRLSRSPV